MKVKDFMSYLTYTRIYRSIQLKRYRVGLMKVCLLTSCLAKESSSGGVCYVVLQTKQN